MATAEQAENPTVLALKMVNVSLDRALAGAVSESRKELRKVDLGAVLARQTPEPYSYEDFLEYVSKEHSEENVLYWEAGMRYRENARPIFPKKKHSDTRSINSKKSTSVQSLNGSPADNTPFPMDDEEALEKKRRELKEELDLIVDTFLVTGADKELNLPQNILKKALIEIREKNNIHPDVLKPSMEKIYELMKTSTFPNFYKVATDKARVNNLPILENGYRRKFSKFK